MTRADHKRTESCLDGQILASYLDGILDPQTRAEAEEHLGGCDRCLSDLASLRLLLTSIEEEPAKAPEHAKVLARNLRHVGFERKRVPKKGFFEKFAAWLSPAPMKLAGAVISAGLVVLILQYGTGGPGEQPWNETVRGGEESGLVLQSPPSGSIQPVSAPIELAWSDMEGTERYVVRVYSEEGSVIFQGESIQPTLTLPAETARLFQPGSEYSWSVEAIRPFQEPIRSPLGTFQVP